MSKQLKQKLNIVLFITGILSALNLSIYITINYFLAGSGVSGGENYLQELFFEGKYSFFIFWTILPSLLFVFGYGVQLTLVFLKPNKRRFIFSIVSYVSIGILLIELVLAMFLSKRFDFPYHFYVFGVGVSFLSLPSITLLLVSIFNLVLAIVLTHSKVKDEEKEEALKNFLISKNSKIHFTIVIVLVFVIFLYFLNTPYLGIYKIFGGPFKQTSTYIYKNDYNSLVYGPILLMRMMLVIGIVFEIVSIIDKGKDKLGFTGIILQLVYAFFLAVFCLIVIILKNKDGYKNNWDMTKWIIWYLSFVLSIVIITFNGVFYFVSRKKQMKLLEIQKEETV